MKRVGPGEPDTHESVRPEGPLTTIRPEKDPAPDEVATYRCMCGFTMDAPSLAVDFAVAS